MLSEARRNSFVHPSAPEAHPPLAVTHPPKIAGLAHPSTLRLWRIAQDDYDLECRACLSGRQVEAFFMLCVTSVTNPSILRSAASRFHHIIISLFHYSLIPPKGSLIGTLFPLLLTLSISSCSSSIDQKTVVTFWAMGFEGEHVGTLVKQFEKLNPEIHVDLQIIPWTSAHDKLLTAFAGNATPDMCQLGNTWIPELHAVGALQSLDSLIAESSIISDTSYFSGIWQTNCIGEHVYGIPWYVDTRALFYRKDLLSAVGIRHPPENWDQLLEVAELLTRYSTQLNGRRSYGIYLPTNPGLEFDEIFFAWQNGGNILKDNDCYSDVLSKEDSLAFDYYLKFFNLGYAPKEANATTNLYQAFASGYVGMFISGPWNIDELRRRVPYLNGKWAVAPLPVNKNRDANAGGSSLVIFHNSKVKWAAWKLVEFLSESQNQLEFYKDTYDLPAVKSAWQDSTLLGNSFVSAFYTQLESARPFPRIPEWEQVTNKMGQWIESAVWGKSTLRQSLHGMDTDINLILKKRRWLRSTGRLVD